MIKVMVVEDEALSLEMLCRLLRESGQVQIAGAFTNPLEARRAVYRLRPDVLFLDIEMPELDGLQLAEELSETDLRCEVVFVTAFQRYALEAFRVNAIDYLLKPLRPAELERTLERVMRRMGMEQPSRREGLLLRVLGQCELYAVGTAQPVRWKTRKCGELLACLSLIGENAGLSKWTLMELLWPGREEEKGDINLRSTVCRLNKTLQETGSSLRVLARNTQYLLSDAPLRVDALELKRLALLPEGVMAETLGCYEQALSAYGGELLEGRDFPWAEALRGEYLRHCAVLVRKLLDYYSGVEGAQSSALGVCERWLALDPFCLEAHLAALELYHKVGGRQESEKFFHKLEVMYATELNLPMPKELEAMYETLS